MQKSYLPLLVLIALTTTLPSVLAAAVPVPSWRHLTSREGDLPVPNGGKEQTTAVIFDVDGDGVNDFVLGERTAAPGVVWMRRSATGWEKYLVDEGARRTEAGGLSYDVDGDGDPDFIVGGDAQSDEIWWYENPRPVYHPATPWKRHLIKQGGGMAHHDQAMADFKKTGRPQLMFWNQKVQKLLLADMPADPRHSGPWPIVEIMDVAKVTTVRKQEGMAVADIDSDKRPDLIAGNFWLKHIKGNEFKPIQFADHPGRVAAGWFKSGRYPQIVLSSGDGDAPLMIYECDGDPTDSRAWKGRDLLGATMIHGHSLDVADINGDGHLDIFTAEMALWKRGAQVPDNPTARAWILYGDGAGNFTPTILCTGIGFHEAKVADLNGDGKLDILNKPYHWDTPRVDVWLNRGNHRNVPAGNFAGPLSMELWTYRDALNQDLVGTLSMIRRLGFTDIETSRLYGKTPPEFRKILDQLGLTCSSMITSLDAITKDVEAVAADAKTLGAGYVIISHLVPHQQKVLTMDDIKRAATDFNRWGAALKKHRLKFAYHPHGREFIRTADGNFFDELLKLTDPELVTFEMDIFWFWHSGVDPVAYLQKHPNRFELMHLKDGRKGTPSGEPTGLAPNPTSVAFGTGVLNFPAVLRAATAAGIKCYYIEDESPYSGQQMRASQEYLRTVKF